jgi:hypothetical protein
MEGKQTRHGFLSVVRFGLDFGYLAYLQRLELVRFVVCWRSVKCPPTVRQRVVQLPTLLELELVLEFDLGGMTCHDIK